MMLPPAEEIQAAQDDERALEDWSLRAKGAAYFLLLVMGACVWSGFAIVLAELYS